MFGRALSRNCPASWVLEKKFRARMPIEIEIIHIWGAGKHALFPTYSSDRKKNT
jgi:hypothetical protein